MTKIFLTASIALMSAVSTAQSQPISEKPGVHFENETVEVSLGDTDVKDVLAGELAIDAAELPLTIHVDPTVAATVCAAADSALDPQTEISAGRTCTAEEASPSLVQVLQERMLQERMN